MKTIHDRVIVFLNAMRSEDVTNQSGLDPQDSAFHIVTEIYTRGNCGNLAVMLSIAFGGQPKILATLYHVVTQIDHRLYDISGDVTDLYASEFTTDTTIKRLIAGDDMMYDCYSFDFRGPLI